MSEGSELTALEKVAAALQEFVNECNDEGRPVLLRGGVVCWESMVYEDDGDAGFLVNYASLPNTSMATTIGILDLATEVAKNDMLGED